jgi:hypothetical protein
MLTDDVAKEILRDGLDDWVPLEAIRGFARLAGVHSEPEIKRIIVDALAVLLDEELITLGSVTKGEGFIPWDGTAAASVERVRTLLETTERNYWEFAAWARNTDAGDRAASQAQREPEE